jgi:predicted nucleotidyltransferase
MTKEYILEKLKENKEHFQQKFSVKKIGLFGSYATNSATDKSDIDIFVALNENSFDNIAGLWNYLEDIYHTKVDLFREHKKSKGAIYEHIKKETIFI